MRAEKGRHEVERTLPLQRGDDLQLLQLVFDVQPVTRLRLGGRRPVFEHPPHALRRLLDQSGGRRGPGIGHCADDAAARGHDLHVRRAANTEIEFACPVARPGEVRVRVDEAGDHRPSARIEGTRRAAAPR